uniref:hypothetical protein n=1 Tax=Paractinoplanes polyasparticus TaxID=2856853 RepID=UPI001C85038D|nr:hypothetical protein [Actinoplanes polyasparticus]
MRRRYWFGIAQSFVVVAGVLTALAVNFVSDAPAGPLKLVKAEPVPWLLGFVVLSCVAAALLGRAGAARDDKGRGRELAEALAVAAGPAVPLHDWQQRIVPLSVTLDGHTRPRLLARVLRRHRRGVVHLEGDALAGKTTALRHHTDSCAVRAGQWWRRPSRLTVYVPLGGFRPDGAPDFASVYQHVEKVVNIAGDTTIGAICSRPSRTGSAEDNCSFSSTRSTRSRRSPPSRAPTTASPATPRPSSTSPSRPAARRSSRPACSRGRRRCDFPGRVSCR